MTAKTCSKCIENKPVSEFRKDRKYKDGYFAWCKHCHKQYARQWRLSNPEKDRAIGRRAYLKATFGISMEQYNHMFSQQNGRCAICNTHQTKLTKILGVDHNHATSQVRGLLCSFCNTAIGLLKENPVLFQSSIAYLDYWRSK